MAYNYGRNTYIKILREFGVDDKDRKQMRELMKEFESNNAYDYIGERNQYVFDELITPSELNYENMYRYMAHSGKSFSEIMEEYRQQLRYFEKGTTKEIEDFAEKTAYELQDMWVEGATIDVVRNIAFNTSDLKDLLYFKSRYTYYESIGDEDGMRKMREEIQKIIDRYL